MTTKATVRPFYPAVGVPFELTLNGPEVRPLKMVRCDGYDPYGWRHSGPVVNVVKTCRFKLVEVGYCPNFDEVRRRLVAHGEIPEGQWREPLKAAYTNDGKGPIGIADASWVRPHEFASLPCIGANDHSDFDWAGSDFGARWRWLMLA